MQSSTTILATVFAAVFAAVLAVPVFATETAGDEPTSEDEIIEEILALRQRLDELWSRLSPEARQRLEETLAEGTLEEEAEPAPAPPPVEVAPPPPTPPAETAPVVAAEPEAPPPPRRRRRCELLRPFDSNDDGRLSALDRAWRHVYLWVDRDGDGRAGDDEVASAYERGVREIALDLGSFVDRKGHLGDVRRGELTVLDVRGDGFGGTGRRADDGVLVFDADALARGGLEVLSAAGEPLGGLEPLRPGWRLRAAGGRIVELACDP